MLNLKLNRGGLRLGVTRQFVMFIKIDHAYNYEYHSGYQLRRNIGSGFVVEHCLWLLDNLYLTIVSRYVSSCSYRGHNNHYLSI